MQRHIIAESELKTVEDKLAQTKKSLEQRERDCLEQEIRLQQIQGSQQHLNHDLETSRKAQQALEERKAQLRQEVTALESHYQEFHAKASSEIEQHKQAEKKKSALQDDIMHAENDLASLQEARGSLERELKIMEDRRHESESALQKLAAQQQSLLELAPQVEQQQLNLSNLISQISQSEKTLAARQAALADAERLAAVHQAAVAEHEALTRSLAQLTGQQKELKQNLIELQNQPAPATIQMTRLQRQLDDLEERKRFLDSAIDLNWGTVHGMSKGLIKHLDLLDEMILHLEPKSTAPETLTHLKVFRAGILDLLSEYSVTAYTYAPDTVVDLAARKRIQIVETTTGKGEFTRITKTFRPGYICDNEKLGMQTLLRKAEVAIETPS